MNIIEAVQALQDGLCEGISRSWNEPRNETSVYRNNGHGVLVNGSGSGPVSTKDITGDDWKLVNLKPQMETKEVKTWALVDSTNGRVWSMGSKEQMEISVSPGTTNLIKIVELTGTYEATAKPKVQHTISADVVVTENGRITMKDGDARVFHQTAACNKNGRVTVEWSE